MHHLRKQTRQARTQLIARNDHVDGAMFQQELATLEAFRQLLAHGLLDHARAGKTDQRLRLGHDDITKHRQAGGNTAIDRISQHGDERQAFFTQARNDASKVKSQAVSAIIDLYNN